MGINFAILVQSVRILTHLSHALAPVQEEVVAFIATQI